MFIKVYLVYKPESQPLGVLSLLFTIAPAISVAPLLRVSMPRQVRRPLSIVSELSNSLSELQDRPAPLPSHPEKSVAHWVCPDR
jgi:hypothetical protein